MILHGEEELEIMKPLIVDIEYEIESKIIDVQDKGKLTIIVKESNIKDSMSKDTYSKATSRIVVRELGGFGYKGTLASKLPNKPER